MSTRTFNALLVEDDPSICQFVRAALEHAGGKVVECDTVSQALIKAGMHKPDVIVLDLGLRDGDGKAFIVQLRTWTRVPVLVLSARTDEQEKIHALDSGADDYLCKPFSVGELLARVRALLRRSSHGVDPGAPLIQFGEIRVDMSRRDVTRQGVPVHLTPIEYRLLACLIQHTGKVVTHRQLLKEVWGPAYSDNNHYLRIYVGHLRQKLEDDPTQPRHILTEIGVGYRFQTET